MSEIAAAAFLFKNRNSRIAGAPAPYGWARPVCTLSLCLGLLEAWTVVRLVLGAATKLYVWTWMRKWNQTLVPPQECGLTQALQASHKAQTTWATWKDVAQGTGHRCLQSEWPQAAPAGCQSQVLSVPVTSHSPGAKLSWPSSAVELLIHGSRRGRAPGIQLPTVQLALRSRPRVPFETYI